jgi:hypothetical protein
MFSTQLFKGFIYRDKREKNLKLLMNYREVFIDLSTENDSGDRRIKFLQFPQNL